MITGRHGLSAVAFMLVFSVALVAYGTTAGTPSSVYAAGNQAVTIAGFAFTPATITVAVGTTVTWTNQDPTDHTVTADDGTTFDSGDIATGATFSFTFTTAGTFHYHCSIHRSMTATVIVTAATPTASLSATATPTASLSATAISTASLSPTAISSASLSPTQGRTATAPPTSTAGDLPSSGSTPLLALLICFALGGLGLAAVEAQRRSIRR